MSLNMRGHIDSVFESDKVTRIFKGNGYYDDMGIWIEQDEIRAVFRANVQPLNDREIVALGIGAERINSIVKIYINNNINNLSLADDWMVDGERYKTIRLDKRKSRTYIKIVAERTDNEAK